MDVKVRIKINSYYQFDIPFYIPVYIFLYPVFLLNTTTLLMQYFRSKISHPTKSYVTKSKIIRMHFKSMQSLIFSLK